MGIQLIGRASCGFAGALMLSEVRTRSGIAKLGFFHRDASDVPVCLHFASRIPRHD
jgi:hypothetical protein